MSEDLLTLQDSDFKLGFGEQVLEVGIDKIVNNPYQPRRGFDKEELVDLSSSIKSLGLIQPLVVRRVSGSQNFEIIAGERRFRAATMAGLKKIPVIIRHWGDAQSAEAALIENVQRVDLNPIEVARSLRNLIGEFDLSQSELAEKIGKKRSTVSNYLRLLGLSRTIQTSLLNNEITMGHAKAILSVEDLGLRDKLHKNILKNGLTVRQAEYMATKLSDGEEVVAKNSTPKDKFTRDLEDKFNKKLGVSVKFKGSEEKGAINIKYKTPEELKRLLSVLA